MSEIYSNKCLGPSHSNALLRVPAEIMLCLFQMKSFSRDSYHFYIQRVDIKKFEFQT